jgi:hypothetical protein
LRKWIYEEEKRLIKSFKFTRNMNLYRKHCKYMGRRHKYIYEDDYLIKLAEKRADLYKLEIEKLKCKFENREEQ